MTKTAKRSTLEATGGYVPFPRVWRPPARYRAFVDFVETWLWIRDQAGRLRPFILNGTQQTYLDLKAEAYDAGRPKEVNTLKTRRCGISTIEQAESYYETSQFAHRHAVTLAQTATDTEGIFDISRTFYREAMPGSPAKPPIPAKDLAERRFKFHEGRSVFKIGTAGAEAFGRGSTFQRAHLSEVAFWKGRREVLEDLLAGIEIATREGEIVRESSPRGAAGLFYEKWQEAKVPGAASTNIFIPWPMDGTNRIAFRDPHQAKKLLADLDEEESALRERLSLDAEQIAWRRAMRLKWGKRFYQEFPEDDESCFLTSGVCFFDDDVLFDLANDLGDGSDRILEKRIRGKLTVWKRPVKGRRYIIGADPSEGVLGGDPAAAGVLDFETGEQVARLHGYIRPPDFARYLAQIGKVYNHATLAPEANNHGQSVLDCLRLIERYPTSRIYHHVDVDRDARKRVKKLGWLTDAKSRPLMLDSLALALRDGGLVVNDAKFLGECRTFNLQENGKYEADEGSHDDLVFAWGIASYVRQASSPILRTKKSEGVGGNGDDG